MSIVTTFNFDNPANYTLNNAAVAGGVGKLALINLAAQVFSQDFAASAGFTFDSGKTEFAGGLVRQLDQKPANALYYNNFSVGPNQTWGTGVGTGTLLNGATVSAGQLNLPAGGAGTNANLNIDTASFPSGQKGAIRFTITTNYSGSPGFNNYFFAASKGVSDIDNLIRIIQIGTNLRIDIFDDTGSSIITVQTGNVFNPTAGVPIEIELNWDVTVGTGFGFRYFRDGVLINSAAGTGARGAIGLFRFGRDYTNSSHNGSNCSIDDVIVFDEPQHSTNYTPGEAIPQNEYLGDKIDLPNFSYSGLGAIQSLDNFTTTETGAPRYIVEGQYWTGSAWAASDNSYAQASSKADVLANLAALNVVGQSEISVSIVTTDNNAALGSVDQLDLTYSGQHYATEGSLLTNSAFVAATLSSFTADETIPANTDIKYIIDVDGQDKYWNGSAWVNSDGTNSQANDLATVQTNISTLLTANATIKIKIVVTTTDQQVTPEIDTVSVVYNFGALEPAAPQQAQVYGFLKDVQNQPIVGATVIIEPNRDSVEYVEAGSRVIHGQNKATTDANGFWTMNLIVSSEYEVAAGAVPMRYKMRIEIPEALETGPVQETAAQDILFEVPDGLSFNITDLIGAA